MRTVGSQMRCGLVTKAILDHGISEQVLNEPVR